MGLRLIDVGGKITLEQEQLNSLTVEQARLIIDHLTAKKVIDRISDELKNKIEKLFTPPELPDEEVVIDLEMPYEQIEGIELFFDKDKNRIYVAIDVDPIEDSKIIKIYNFCRIEGLDIEPALKARVDAIKKKNFLEKEVLKTSNGVKMFFESGMNEIKFIGNLDKLPEKDACEIFKKCVWNGYWDKIDLKSRMMIVARGKINVKNNISGIEGLSTYEFAENKFVLFEGVVTQENAPKIYKAVCFAEAVMEFNLKNIIFSEKILPKSRRDAIFDKKE